MNSVPIFVANPPNAVNEVVIAVVYPAKASAEILTLLVIASIEALEIPVMAFPMRVI